MVVVNDSSGENKEFVEKIEETLGNKKTRSEQR